MNLSDKGAMELISHEGIVLTPYYDSVGVLTWGVGHTAKAGEPLPSKLWGKEASLAEVFRVFKKDAERYAAQVRLAFTAPLTQAQFDAAVSFHFNTGAINRATWVKKFNAGDIAGAKKGFMDWRKPAEIIPRRRKECDLFFKGIYSGGGKATVYPATSEGNVLWGKGKQVDLAAALAKSIPATPFPAPDHIPDAGKKVPNSAGWVVLAATAVSGIVIAAWDWIVAITGYVSPWW